MRVFLGFPVSDELSLELLTLRDKAIKSMAGAGPKPVIAANFHMTLAFCGEVNTARLEQMTAVVSAISPRLSPITLELTEAHCFPDARSTIFAVEAVSSAQAQRLQRTVLRALGEPESRPWRPHITLSRLQRAYVPAPQWTISLPFDARELCLYESVQSQWGVRYRVLQRWALTDVN
jgi:RNA 2',3'-cyclic 3'-phosphodiesterase